jgi:hypothetical protein
MSSLSPVRLTNTKGLRMWLQVVSLANRFPWQEEEKERTTPETVGLKQSKLFAELGPDGFSERTSQDSLILGTSQKYSGRWPKQGMMQNGLCSELTIAAPPTNVADSGSWPTPTQDMAAERKKKYAQGGTPLTMAVRMWPTPTANEDAAGTSEGKMQKMLGNHPDVRNTGAGTLNPTWVEWLMGWPLEWTDLKPLETDKFHLWLQQHGNY